MASTAGQWHALNGSLLWPTPQASVCRSSVCEELLLIDAVPLLRSRDQVKEFGKMLLDFVSASARVAAGQSRKAVTVTLLWPTPQATEV